MRFANPSFERGRILYQQRRYDLAAREFQRALAADPMHSSSSAMLALCYTELGKHRDAIETAKNAVGNAPDEAYCHYALAHTLSRSMQFSIARVAAREAVRLNPDKALYYGQLALIEFNSGQLQTALRVAEQGLSIDPQEINSNLARIRALDRLGRKQESKQNAAELLRIAPDDQFAHSNIGWSFLEHRDWKQAISHFREALRINPKLELAQKGLVEALHCRFFFYRVFRSLLVRFQTWARQPLTITGTLKFFALMPIFLAALLLSFVFAPWIKISTRFNRFGRLVLTHDQTIEANINTALLALAAATFIGSWITYQSQLILASIAFNASTFLITNIFRTPRGRLRWISTALTSLFLLYIVGCQIHLFLLSKRLSIMSQRYADIMGIESVVTYFAFMFLLIITTRLSRAVPRR
jgi:tetratricopeptide (TPR) repeat protein